MTALRGLCFLLFLPALLEAVEVRSLSIVHDGSLDPPGFKLELTLRVGAADKAPDVALRVLRVSSEQPLGGAGNCGNE
jgi:hypothetical protein